MNLFIGDAILRTKRLELRPQALDDARAIFESFASDPRVTTYMDWLPAQVFDSALASERYLNLASDMAEGKRIAWVIRRLDEAQLCGKIELRIDGDGSDIGFVLAATHWGHGIMTEAISAVLGFARRLGLRSVTGTCDPDNRASIRVFEKCGFRYSGRRIAALIRPALSEKPRDSECYEVRFETDSM